MRNGIFIVEFFTGSEWVWKSMGSHSVATREMGINARMHSHIAWRIRPMRTGERFTAAGPSPFDF